MGGEVERTEGKENLIRIYYVRMKLYSIRGEK